jgi:hypothetical protein
VKKHSARDISTSKEILGPGVTGKEEEGDQGPWPSERGRGGDGQPVKALGGGGAYAPITFAKLLAPLKR